MKYSPFLLLSICWSVSARPTRRATFTLQNGEDAIALNNKFRTLTADSACTAGQNACIGNKFAQCNGGKFATEPCGAGTICAALPLVNSAGTSITCTTQSDLDARIAATGAKDANASVNQSAPPAANHTATTSKGSTTTAKAKAPNGSSTDAQSSLTLDPSVISTGFDNDGQDVPAAGQVASLTSRNNFINFCATVPKLPLTNGKQVTSGSCNTAPMGVIPSSSKMPSSKFTFPQNGAKIHANKNFTITMAIQNLETGHFVNAEQNYFAAPQQVNNQGQIIGHSHVVVEKLAAIDQITLTNPSQFAFFKGLNDAAANGVLSAVVSGGLPAGFYKLSSINSAANHQPVLAPIAQHGSLDDAVYFTVTNDDTNDSGSGKSTTTSSSTTNKKPTNHQ
jgi:hypothetical protein